MSKSFETVTDPQNFKPEIMNVSNEFEQHWDTNKKWVLSNLSHIAYFGEEKISAFMDLLGENKTYFYDHKGAQAFLSIWEDKAILTFRGTQIDERSAKKKKKKLSLFRRSIMKLNVIIPMMPFTFLSIRNDIFADIKFCKTRLNKNKKTKVHSGFLQEFKKIWKPIKEHINKEVGDKPIWVTGHSLGAAMATIAGTRHVFEAVTTFGEPRVGSKISEAFQAKTHNRYVNGDDPVTMVPPRLFFYKHHTDAKPIKDKNGDTSIIYDHSIIYYSENLFLN